MDFFRNLSVGETGSEKYSDAMSETHSMASHRTHATGSLVSQLSVESSRPGRSRVPCKTKEDMALLKGQMASMQEAIKKLSTLPAFIASIPAFSGRKDSENTEPGRKSLSHRTSQDRDPTFGRERYLGSDRDRCQEGPLRPNPSMEIGKNPNPESRGRGTSQRLSGLPAVSQYLF